MTEKEPSPAVLNPHLRLAAALVYAAVKDYIHGDPLTRLDAALWLINDGILYMSALDIPVEEPEEILCQLANDRPKRTRRRIWK